MKKPIVFLHLGSTKCGSTSLQYFLNSHYDALRAHGILVPKAARGQINHLGLALYSGRMNKWRQYAAFQGLSEILPEDFDSYLETQLDREIQLNAPKQIVFSFEGLFRWREPEIAKLMSLLRQFSDNIQAVVTLRRHDRWAVSSYNTRLVGHGTTCANQLLRDDGKPHGINCAHQLGLWGAHIPRDQLTVLAFDDHDDILHAHLNALRMGQFAKPLSPRKNLSISAFGQSLILRYNQLRNAEGVAPETERGFRLKLKFVLPTGAPLRPSQEQVRQHLEYFEEDRELLRQSFLPSSSRFFQDLVDYPKKPDKIDISDDELAGWISKAKNVDNHVLLQKRGVVPV